MNHSGKNKHDNDTPGKTFSWKTFDMDKFFKEADSIGFRKDEEEK